MDGFKQTFSGLYRALGVVLSLNGTPQAHGECPWCGKGGFYLNVENGLWDCKKCQESGNHTTFLTRWHKGYLEQTTADNYKALKDKRGIAPQTLRRHELAYDASDNRWLIPFKNAHGNVVNVQFYYPNRPKDGPLPSKVNLPQLPLSMFGFDKLAGADKDRTVHICEGPFDAIALDYSIGAKHRDRHVIVATPGAFKEAWAEYFRGFKVRALYDNDDPGRKHGERVRKLLAEAGVTSELLVLQWPDGFPDGFDINDLVSELAKEPAAQIRVVREWVEKNPKRGTALGFAAAHCVKSVVTPKLAWEHGWERKSQEPEVIDWVWPNRLRCKS
jgi:hypothetical protein